MENGIAKLPANWQNSEPPEGWGDELTEEEISYVNAFGRRPDRPGWLASEESFRRLDVEAASLSQERPLSEPPLRRRRDVLDAGPTGAQRPSRKRLPRWLAVAILIPSLAGATVLTFLAFGNVREAERLEVQREQVEQSISELR